MLCLMKGPYCFVLVPPSIFWYNTLFTDSLIFNRDRQLAKNDLSPGNPSETLAGSGCVVSQAWLLAKGRKAVPNRQCIVHGDSDMSYRLKAPVWRELALFHHSKVILAAAVDMVRCGVGARLNL